ncbi:MULTISPECIES: efflux transporter outer membrane subunit [unclassified Sphingomonas]|uniref:efflux transporter outer membrane subunit n=1 Tax=unclassified Sphingomonas TaxID=196159 RepID=UPI000BDAE427|nr:MAG: transporter [Sphingomonas sp. 12-62-6]OYX37790.1 MAG: transporter [Sphingomonas sp. 32-62-10]
MIRPLTSIAALLALTACSMVAPDKRPALPVPAAFPSGGVYGEPGDAALPMLGYRDVFRDARLQAIIDQALDNNRDLRIAAANIESARAQYRAQRAEQMPLINSNNSASFVDPGTGRSNVNGSPVQGGQRTNLNIGLGITQFEIDLFGRLAALSRADQARYFASDVGARATRLALIGDIGAAWLQYAADKSLLAIAEETVANASASVRLTRARLDGGIAARTDVAQAETVLATAQSDRATQMTALAQDVNALQLLVGAPVDAALLPGSITEAAGSIGDAPPALDTSILLRRPDVVQAEYQLRAANAEVGAARAALLPRLLLTALAGLASNGLSQLFTTRAFNYTATPTLSYPVFAGGRNKAALAQARAQFDIAVASYERAIQVAFREVADALARRGTIDDQLGAQQRLAAAATDSYRLTEARYRGGIDSFLANLDAQRSLYQAQRSLTQTQLVAATNRITLYRTLGGDALTDVGPDGTVAASPTKR